MFSDYPVAPSNIVIVPDARFALVQWQGDSSSVSYLVEFIFFFFFVIIWC